ncbi:hypothetical protein VIMY103929_06410 [Vibrio mytili]|uniref:Uncharacterized protein n=1 Tax=Vibrio mytili TaxID=50718 RepID=A0A0C3I9H2_9VIBR|nr:hypothetical protein SU60_10980 [Vibrio mytili]
MDELARANDSTKRLIMLGDNPPLSKGGLNDECAHRLSTTWEGVRHYYGKQGLRQGRKEPKLLGQLWLKINLLR